jgi:hypothetical protein
LLFDGATDLKLPFTFWDPISTIVKSLVFLR